MDFLKVSICALVMVAVASAQSLQPEIIDTPEGPVNLNPVYNYALQVAAEEEQTYMSQEEKRQGNSVTGKYSYVDPFGSLVTVTYTAGAQGYSEERTVTPAFVTIRPKPRKEVVPVVAPINPYTIITPGEAPEPVQPINPSNIIVGPAINPNANELILSFSRR